MEEMIIYLTLALLLLGGIVLFFFGIYRIKLNRNIRERKEFENRSIQALLQTKVEIRDQTLKDVSLEIHDNIAQVLSLAKLHLSSAQSANLEDASVRLGSAKDLVSRAIHDLRDLSRSLSTDQVGILDWLQSLEQQVEQIRKAGSYEVYFTLKGPPKDIGQHRGLILFRIIQECLQNVLKHSGASLIKLDVNFTDSELIVCVIDDGRGFDTAKVADGQGLGNIRERAMILGATCSVSSTLKEGTTIKIVIPLKYNVE